MSKPRRHCRECTRWRIRWIDENGKRRSETYDDYKTALLRLRQHEARADEIKRGLRSPEPPTKTFDELLDYWADNRAPLKRSAVDDLSMIRCHLRPAFGSLRLRELNGEHIDRFILERQHLNKKTVRNQLTLLTTMMNAAVDLGWLRRVPKIRKPKVRKIRHDYRWLRTSEEIQRFLTASRTEDEHVFVMYAAAIYTGMRAGELAGLGWGDVNLDRRLITVQRSFDGPTKAEDIRYVPVLDPLLPVLRAWRLRHPGRLVFTNRDGRMFGEAARVFQEVLHRVLDTAEFPLVHRRGKLRRYITFHDLRHTFASHWVANGGDIFKLQKILGHKSMEMTMRYAHLAPDAFADDLDRLGTSVPATQADVVPLRAETK